jgi:integrase/recombinase XerC
MRLAELEQFMVKDIDFYTKTIKVTGKRNKQRIIPVSDVLLQRIKII